MPRKCRGKDCVKRYLKSWRRIDNNSNRQKELEIGDRERSKEKMRRGRRRKDDINHGQSHP